MKRVIKALIVVEAGDIPAAALNNHVVDYFEKQGFKAATPHAITEPLVVEITDELTPLT